MLLVYNFINNVNGYLLNAYFNDISVTLKNTLWDKNPDNITRVIKEINGLNPTVIALIKNDIRKINNISKDDFQKIIFGISNNVEKLMSLSNAVERGVWCYLYDLKIFKRVEYIIYANNYRFSKYWNGYLTDREWNGIVESSSIKQFNRFIKSTIDNNRTFKINHFTYSIKNMTIFQLIISMESNGSVIPKFNNIVSRDINPISEYVILCNIKTGAIEVIAGEQNIRIIIASLFIKYLISKGKKYNLWRYNLAPLITREKIPLIEYIDTSNNIKSINLIKVKFKDISDGSVILLDVPLNKHASINKYIVKKFSKENALIDGRFIPVCAHFSVNFIRKNKNNFNDALLVKITPPNKDNLNIFPCEKKNLIKKYFKHLNLLEDVIVLRDSEELTLSSFKLLLTISEHPDRSILSEILYSNFPENADELINGGFLVADNGTEKITSRFLLNDDSFLNFFQSKLRIPERQKPYFILNHILWFIGSTCIKDSKINFYFCCNILNSIDNPEFVDAIKNNIKKNNSIILHSGKRNIIPITLPYNISAISIYNIIDNNTNNIKLNINILYMSIIKHLDNEAINSKLQFSADYRSVNWNGKFYSMSKRQASVIECIYNEGGKVHHDFIRNQTGIKENISKIMRMRINGKWVYHPLWKTLLKNYPGGYYYIDI